MSPQPSAPELGAWSELADGVWVLVGEPASVNLGLIIGSDRALLVDAGSSPAQGHALRKAVASVTDVPVGAVVLTHWHYDHAFGLAGFEDVETVAHESVRARLLGSDAATAAAGLGFAASELALPNREIAVAAALELGGRRVEIAHLGRGHTEGDLMVVVADADLVFAGDLIESARLDPASESASAVWYGDDSYPHEWASTLDGLIGLLTSRSRAVPGHGDPVDREFVFGQRGRVAAVSGEIRHLAETGVPSGESLARGNWPFPVDHIAAGIEVGYAQLGPVTARRQLPLA
jgi:glyoxylase-like metal-dependent hydrolase (beta-lactamase superfamily II)